jgi:hypothetical protein
MASSPAHCSDSPKTRASGRIPSNLGIDRHPERGGSARWQGDRGQARGGASAGGARWATRVARDQRRGGQPPAAAR